MELRSVNVGCVRDHLMDGKLVRSGIVKEPVDGPVIISTTGLAGDGIGNTKNHGGPDQAVYAYAAEHYDAWTQELGRGDLTYGMMGENLTVRGWREADACIGDVLRVGEAVVQVTGHRTPCYKLDWLVGDKQFSQKFTDARRFGMYLRVVEPGGVKAGDAVEVVEKSPAGLGLIELAELFLFNPHDVDAMRRALEVEGLGERIRLKFEQRIAAAK